MKWHGKVGFVISEEKEPGLFKVNAVERPYYGELLQSKQTYNDSQSINSTIQLSNRLRIVASPFINSNKRWIRYVVIDGEKWVVKDTTIQYPNVILNIGGVYTGG